MSIAPKIYLAGPDVFREDSIAHGKKLAEICAEFGMEGCYPLDNIVTGEGEALAENIFKANVAQLRMADAVLVNMSPFRGPGMDGGSCWEMGFAYAMNLPIVGYTDDLRSYIARAHEHYLLRQDKNGMWRDLQEMSVEDFGLTDNLMMACSAKSGPGIIFNTPEFAAQWLANHFDLQYRNKGIGK